MKATTSAKASRRAGFSIILSLTMMTMIIMLLLVLMTFLTIESRASRWSILSTRSRLNALMSARLALGHLQQATGPDARSTATGELACTPAPISPFDPGMHWTQRPGQGQRYWTGAWRTDKPDEPPQWLISGKGGKTLANASSYLAQSVSLSGATDYSADKSYWAPWQRDYPITYAAGNKESYVTLVGNGSATLDAGPDGLQGTADDIDGRVALPKIPLPGPWTNSTTGNFAYWIGDEGVKATIGLTDPRDVTKAAPAALDTVNALRSPSRRGTELLLGLKNVSTNEPKFPAVFSTAMLSMLPGYDLNDPAAAGLPPAKLAFHHHTLWSAGVLADSYRGGLRRDLSLAFEMEDSLFDKSDFGSGNGHETVIEAYTADPLLGQRRSWFPSYGTAKTNPGTVTSSDPRPRVWVPMYEDNIDNPGRNLGTNGTKYLSWSPVFIREDEMLQPLVDTSKNMPTVTTNTTWDGQPRRLVGPLWHLVRDYYRLYKEVDWNAGKPVLGARAFFPNTNQFDKGGYRIAKYARYDLDNALWSGGGKVTSPYTDGYDSTPDPLGWVNGLKGGDLTGHGVGRFIPRPVRGAYMPAVHRFSMVFSLRTVQSGANYTLKLVCTPILVIHNPYNVQLKLKEPTTGEPDPRIKGGLKISFSQFDQMRLQIFTHVGNDPSQAINTTATARLFDSLFNFNAASNASTGSNAENLVAVVPATTLEPGEFAVFTTKDLVDASTLGKSVDAANIPILNMQRGFYFTGGFHTDIRASSTADPYLFKAADQVKCCIDLTSSMYWHHWIYLNSGWKKSLKDDAVSADGQDLGAGEVLGTSRNNSLASYAHYINVGGSGYNVTHVGDAGSVTNPVAIGPVSSIRTIAEIAPGPVVAAFDTRARVADTARTTSYDRNALSYFSAQANPVPAAHPAWLFSNPLPQTSSNPALNGLPGIGMASLRTQLFGGDELALNGSTTSWSNLLQIDAAKANGSNGLGGPSHGVGGLSTAMAVEVPVTAPVSLGQFMHANLTPWDWMPYRSVGNSFPSMVVPLDKSWTHGTPHTNASYISGHTFGDMSYLMNNALWDSFFFSGAAPVLSDGSRNGNYNAVRAKSLTQVITDFAAGTGKLANPRMTLFPNDSASASALLANGFLTDSTGVAPDGYRRFSSYLLNVGAFNVNSTSVEAWTGLYASLKGLALGSQAANSPAATNNARVPRIIGDSTQAPATRNIADAAYWNGYVNLSDTQLRALAVATVAEVKARAQFLQRTERDQEYPPATRRFLGFPAAQNPGTPFLGLCEFVNRFLGPTKKAGALVSTASANTSYYQIENTAADTTLPVTAQNARWMFRSGTLESAIARADKALGSETLAKMPSGSSAKMIDPSVSHNWTNGGVAGGRTGMPPGLYFRNVEILDTDNVNRTHTGFGANGCLFQGDLLQALGPTLATRSDTFKIRAYGEADEDMGPGQGAVLELVVQRSPNYIDPTTAAHDRLRDAGRLPINVLLGRRFIILSFRWLSPSEI